eukprot:TRINITY_DN2573_c0_g2_i1.p1 TRINITY_DN2573_c0_g2~~TRINITY_DN2573_c0_g2_i1.p1  ORF type:complete len:697 (-),score=131.22 TRINITY_DN2573_c0_g2_i1:3499-5589(-)
MINRFIDDEDYSHDSIFLTQSFATPIISYRTTYEEDEIDDFSFSPMMDYDPDFDDVYFTDIHESLQVSDDGAELEWDDSHFVSTTPPMKIPSFNSDSVFTRRRSVSERRNSVCSSSFNEEMYIFSPFSFESRSVPDSDTPPVTIESIIGDKDIGTDWFKELSSAEEEGDMIQLKKKFKKFTRLAIRISRLIIFEAHLPIEEKSIPPLHLGVAGGEKYIYGGIFIKFAIDERGIYGGDKFAAKAAGRELNGLNSIREANIPGIYTPYMVLIDFRGFRLIATTLISPLSEHSLKYGSQDGGKTVHDDHPEVRNLITKLCQELNLKKHCVGDNKEMYGPVDLEAHLGDDNRCYILDTARLFPPFPPDNTFVAFKICEKMEGRIITPVVVPYDNWEDHIPDLIDGYISEEKLLKKEFSSGVLFHGYPQDFLSAERNTLASSLLSSDIFGDVVLVYTGGSIGRKFHSLLRKELVKQSETPLSSDAFTKFDVGPDKLVNEEEVKRVTQKLINEIIPNAAKFQKKINTGRELCEYLHSKGINLSKMGLVRDHTISERMRNLILKEMIFRSVKNDMRSELRRIESVSDQDWMERCSSFLNLLFGSSQKSTEYWCFFIKTVIIYKFGEKSLSENERRYEFDCRHVYQSKKDLFEHLIDGLYVNLTKESKPKFTRSSTFRKEEPFETSDLLNLSVKYKAMTFPGDM